MNTNIWQTPRKGWRTFTHKTLPLTFTHTWFKNKRNKSFEVKDIDNKKKTTVRPKVMLKNKPFIQYKWYIAAFKFGYQVFKKKNACTVVVTLSLFQLTRFSFKKTQFKCRQRFFFKYWRQILNNVSAWINIFQMVITVMAQNVISCLMSTQKFCWKSTLKEHWVGYTVNSCHKIALTTTTN